MQYLSIRLGNIKYGIPIEKVVSIEPHSDFIKLPCGAEYVTGIKNLHGNTIPVYNLSKRFGNPADKLMNIVIVTCSGFNVGLEVDEVLSLENAAADEVEAMPQMIKSSQKYMMDVAHKGTELTVMVDIDKLLDEFEMEEMEKMLKGES
ncbi:MAG: chemotaxis protein CheW [Lachnospiraceae bacterium]|nr:chemotaxis protein CheW [Lachnospiraceae bacterium]